MQVAARTSSVPPFVCDESMTITVLALLADTSRRSSTSCTAFYKRVDARTHDSSMHDHGHCSTDALDAFKPLPFPTLQAGPHGTVTPCTGICHICGRSMDVVLKERPASAHMECPREP